MGLNVEERELEWCLHMQNYILIRYSEWLLGCCYVVTMVFLVSRALLVPKSGC